MTASTVEAARERLKAAHANRADADLARDAARLAAQRAREFVEGIRERRDVLAEVGRNINLDRSGPIKAAIIAGEAHPQFEPLPSLSAHAAALAEAESQLQAAQVACDAIEGEDSAATGEVNAAQEEVRAAAQSLMLSEATDVAEKIAALDAEALALRVRLGGGSMCPIATQGLQLTETLAAVLRQTDERWGDMILRNGVLWDGVKHAAQVWRDYMPQLMESADAELNFDQPEQPRATAAE